MFKGAACAWLTTPDSSHLPSYGFVPNHHPAPPAPRAAWQWEMLLGGHQSPSGGTDSPHHRMRLLSSGSRAGKQKQAGPTAKVCSQPSTAPPQVFPAPPPASLQGSAVFCKDLQKLLKMDFTWLIPRGLCSLLRQGRRLSVVVKKPFSKFCTYKFGGRWDTRI